METLDNLLFGIAVALETRNLAYCFLGVVLGVLVGVLPGLGSAATIAMLLPMTYHIETTAAIIMLAGIWYGSMFGGAITAILLGIPGQSTAVMTVLDGNALTRQGKAGLALGTAVFSSFAGGLIGFAGLALVAPTLARMALKFGPPEFFALAFAGLTLVAYLATSSTLKAFIATVIGLFLGMVGLDPITAEQRFTYDLLALQGGVGLVPLIMGLFGVTEVFLMLEARFTKAGRVEPLKGLGGSFPDRKLRRRLFRPVLKGGIIGFLTGILPGCGAAISSYVSYVVVKRWSRNPEAFGKGAIEGVAGPEAGNNAATCSGMIPLLTLGLPADIVPAIMLGAFLLHGVTPGPDLVIQHPDIFWGIVASFLIGNLMLLIIVTPLLAPIARITELPVTIIAPVILAVTLAGAYGVNNQVADIWLMLGFGVFGYLMRKFDYPAAPLVLAFVLGPIMEASMRQSLILSRGSFSIFVERPLSGGLLVLAALVVAGPPLLETVRKMVRDTPRSG